jgi:hypothetical protein
MGGLYLFPGMVSTSSAWRLIGDGESIHWPDLDEDISMAIYTYNWSKDDQARPAGTPTWKEDDPLKP